MVLLSARSSVENQLEGLRYGADLYITKPFNNDLLLASLENLLYQRKKLFEWLSANKSTPLELNPAAITITHKDELFLKQVIDIVEERMSDPDFNIDSVAESINMGRSTFYKKFKSLTHLPTVEFIRDMRLKRSKQYMDAGETNITTIAYAVGFNNPKYFSTCFREKFNITPTEYLKSIKQHF
jgi:AraC-like DNA-binding protein